MKRYTYTSVERIYSTDVVEADNREEAFNKFSDEDTAVHTVDDVEMEHYALYQIEADLSYVEYGAPAKFTVIFRDCFNKGVLHVFDRNLPDTKSVTNAVNSEFIDYIIDELEINKEFEIFLYGTDGIVVKWDDNEGFAPLPEEDVRKYGIKKFLLVMEERKRDIG
ncbi:MAG: hypothetical protein ACOCQR_00885 [bacterium]